MIIEDGTGKKAAVSNKNLLKALTFNFEYEHYANHTAKKFYSVVFDQSPDDNATFLYIQNESDDDLVIGAAKLYCDTTGVIELVINSTGTPANTTTNSPVNRNGGSASSADCKCYTGDNITGLSGGSIVDRLYCLGSHIGTTKFIWRSGLILVKNSVLTMNIQQNSGVEIFGTLSMYFHSEDD